MKSCLVIETPKTCGECLLCNISADNDEFWVCEFENKLILEEFAMNGKAKWCPLKPLPKKPKPVDMELEPYIKHSDAEKWEFYCIGFNDALKEITDESHTCD